MPRALLLCSLCLLLPGLTFGSNQFESIALAGMAPLIGGLLFITIALLLAAPFILKADFYSSRRAPGPLLIATMLLALLIGLFISGISYQFDKGRENPFPNLLTEVYVPIALLFIFVKQLKVRRSPTAVLWIGSGAACLLTLTSAVAGLASIGEHAINQVTTSS